MTDAGSPKKELQVDTQMSLLNDAISEINAAVERLFTRLSRFIRSVPPEKTNESKDEKVESLVDFALTLNGFYLRIKNIEKGVKELLNRLEI